MNWVLKPKPFEKFIKQFPEYQPLVLQLLYNRGLKTQKAIDEFFNPDYGEDLHDPFLMLGMKEAVKRISKAIKKQEKIAIFGDYDADGVCGAVILKTILEALGAKLNGVFIPNRMTEGYGLNNEAVKKADSQGTDLVITIDCGITDFGEIKLANSLGMEVIIVDHHRVGEKLPPAKIIIDPWQKKDGYPFKELAGAGVAFKLVQALMLQSDEIKPGWEKWLLDLVAIATVADCVPLLGENRTLVRYGLIVLAQTQRIGLQELMKIARLNPIFETDTMTTNLDTYSLGFILAPRLNAAGRMKHASLAFELLLAKTVEEAKCLAEKINEQNQQRQKLTDEIVTEIEARIKSYIGDKSRPVIIEIDKKWSPGVIGLVAGKIADRYHRPTIIFSARGGSASGGKEDEEIIRGSARSIPTFNIIEAISQCAELLKEYGGHPGAAGLSLENKKLPAFSEKINRIAREKLKEEDLVPFIEIDSEINLENIDWELFDKLSQFEPCGGDDNPRPTFLIKDLEIVNLRLVGNGFQHLKLELKNENPPAGGENKVFKAIGFRLAKNGGQNLKVGDKVDIVFELIIDEWNGSRELQFKIIDIRKSL
ncbi:MAG: single-stranded-DNA-specific exonuclease RecJ [Candidatus Portnoybacteria bacterium CG_4_8_14_3_um_filter_40_10]|uniref:Single-stranded-DNA-specific exonuclease RecJ n=3 Tax=Candidatus Portnoyibacteriota TaxID=1817913 RepID=A0A2M7IHU3_9BACT|nr:MAG: single-stranded-DNA-specific exonuclease RecJ [Candidatus Portnoybacteria bacterium CG11_big_fil_rev_8_21_14_0_20_40_15]PIS31639.1 MAG: single-stranded-DNA-specific exonuclease RecJ [Candidatus Portnoybacteria bacterium CG08_land_8_20_14_0_20_40_83]PIW76051.1 MAG: single-stranded-DNA-specific exonuclease RecJ [Candidatus Portnoybacteria bacterium CG_4_8_14_3_um_filter_40_10]PIY74570.1 MAG: single-stranded-DNA-specific exonuclease RecJ [Candidatus Portnoybacteria bacterium CG_4_10_14_0_8_